MQGQLLAAKQTIGRAITLGVPLDDVDAELIEPLALGGDEKAALWLFAFHMLGYDVRQAFVTDTFELFSG